MLAQEQFRENRKQYMPVTTMLRNWFGEDGDQEIQGGISDARQTGLGAGDTAAGIAGRDQDRYGASMTPGMRQQFQTDMAMDRTSGGIGAANNARQQFTDTRLAGMQNYIGMGHGLGSEGLGGIISGANMATDRNLQNSMMRDQASAQSASNNMSLGMSAAMMMMMI